MPIPAQGRLKRDIRPEIENAPSGFPALARLDHSPCNCICNDNVLDGAKHLVIQKILVAFEGAPRLLHLKPCSRAGHGGRINRKGIGDAKSKADIPHENFVELDESSAGSAWAVGKNNVLAGFQVRDFARFDGF